MTILPPVNFQGVHCTRRRAHEEMSEPKLTLTVNFNVA